MFHRNGRTLSTLFRHINKISVTNLPHPRFSCELFEDRAASIGETDTKVTVVGSGKVGAACAMALLTQEISSNVVLIDDKNENRLNGEVLDMQHGSLFFSSQVEGTTDYKKTANSKVCVITIGAKGATTKEQIMDLGKKNTDSFKKIIPELVKYSPHTILLILSKPADIMSYIAWKLSALPVNKVIGMGTTVSSARFRYFISQKLGIPSTNCQTYVIGGQFDQVPVWSSISLGGDRLRELNPDAGTDKDKEKWKEVYESVVNSCKQITEAKGDTCWANGLAVGSIVKSILRNTRDIYTVSTNAKDFHSIPHDVFLSLPCVLNACGLRKVVKQKLNEEEKGKILKCAENLKNMADSFNIC